MVAAPAAKPGPWHDGYLPGSSEYRRLLAALVCAGLAAFAQLYSPQGILPLISSQLRVSEAQSALLISAATIGLAAGALPWAWVAGRVGSLAAMKAAMVLAIIFGVASVVATEFSPVLIFRVLEGFALGGIPAVAIAYVHDEVAHSSAAVAVALYVSGTSVGGLAGRLIAAPAAEALGWRFGVAAVLAFSAIATLIFIVIAPRQRGVKRARRKPGTASTHPWRELFSPAMIALYAQGFLMMGSFVAIYNYLGFRLQGEPFGLTPSVTSLLFLAYLAGTVSSQRAGKLAVRVGRLRVVLAGIALFASGILLTAVGHLSVIIMGLVAATAGFFAVHAVASGWTGARLKVGGARGPAIYNVAYYVGSSVMGWLGGFAFAGLGWPGLVAMTLSLAAIGAVLAAAFLRGDEVAR